MTPADVEEEDVLQMPSVQVIEVVYLQAPLTNLDQGFLVDTADLRPLFHDVSPVWHELCRSTQLLINARLKS